MNALADLSPVAPLDMRHPAFRHDTHALLRENHRVSRVVRDVLGLPHEDFAQTKTRVATRSTGT
jgi:hypothetical protein